MANSIWPLIGIGAALLTSTSFIPQLIVRLKKPDQARVAYSTLWQFMTGALLWTFYGIHLKDWIIIGANIFILSNLSAIVVVQWLQEKKSK